MFCEFALCRFEDCGLEDCGFTIHNFAAHLFFRGEQVLRFATFKVAVFERPILKGSVFEVFLRLGEVTNKKGGTSPS